MEMYVNRIMVVALANLGFTEEDAVVRYTKLLSVETIKWKISGSPRGFLKDYIDKSFAIFDN